MSTVVASRSSIVGNDVVLFVALLATALACGPALVHALELSNKIVMTRDDYLVAQQIYRGWNQLAYVLAVQLSALIAVALRFWHRSRVVWPTLMAIGSLAAAQMVFWILTLPANVATENWTIVPANWEALRAQWEYSHLAGAACQLIAMVALIVAALARRRTIDD